jgi:DNA invertase Pin-like site-specific DNA recombinase
MESGVDFTACDMPDANRLTVHIMAAMAEHEARCISERTKAALEQAKRRGTQLGCHNAKHRRACPNNWRAKGTRNGLGKAQSAAAENAAQRRSDCYSHLFENIQAWRHAGESYKAIAARLNTAGEVTTGGKPFAAMTVKRLLER